MRKTIESINSKGKVYLASPWFNDEQFERCEWLRDTLIDLGFNVFSPKDENLVIPDADLDWREQAFKGNINAINDCSFLIAITNGKDMGTIFECGHAYSIGKPIVYFAEGLNGQFNLMLAQSGKHVITSREQLVEDFKKVEFLNSLYYNLNFKEYTGAIE